jgi:hypothetical protein
MIKQEFTSESGRQAILLLKPNSNDDQVRAILKRRGALGGAVISQIDVPVGHVCEDGRERTYEAGSEELSRRCDRCGVIVITAFKDWRIELS